jgi:hypothetical protein
MNVARDLEGCRLAIAALLVPDLDPGQVLGFVAKFDAPADQRAGDLIAISIE